MKNERQRRNIPALIKGIMSIVIFSGIAFLPQLHAQMTSELGVDLDSVCQVIRGFGGANVLIFGRPDMTPAEVKTAFGNGNRKEHILNPGMHRDYRAVCTFANRKSVVL